jgi:SAM-dependent methyltransferase
MASRVRIESNEWLKPICANIKGKVLSIGSMDDKDRQGSFYKDYFASADSYVTSSPEQSHKCDLLLDVRDMKEVADEEFDCIYCSGVLEHVFEYQKGLSEMKRVLKSGGTLLLGLPFKQAIHMAPTDYWRFTKFALEKMLEDDYIEVNIADICGDKNFPVTYWVKATKK